MTLPNQPGCSDISKLEQNKGKQTEDMTNLLVMSAFTKKYTPQDILRLGLQDVAKVSEYKREEFLKKQDNWDTEQLFHAISEKEEIKPYLIQMLQNGLSLNSEDKATRGQYLLFWAAKNSMTMNEYTNKVMWVQINPDTEVLFEWKRMPYRSANHEIAKIFIRQALDSQIQNLKKDCSA